MQIFINGKSYMLSENILSRQDTRESYFELANTVFGLKFDNWYQSGYWDNKFIPYVLYDGNVAAASVGVCINNVIWKNMSKLYVQLWNHRKKRTIYLCWQEKKIYLRIIKLCSRCCPGLKINKSKEHEIYCSPDFKLSHQNNTAALAHTSAHQLPGSLIWLPAAGIYVIGSFKKDPPPVF